MTQEDIISMAREAGFEVNEDGEVLENSHFFQTNKVERFATRVAAAEREKLAHWMRNFGYATGHGDTIEDLLDHLGTQIAEGLEAETMAERQRCAQIAREWDITHPSTNFGGCIARFIEGNNP